MITMSTLKEDSFYRNITKRGDKYQLRKNGEHYGYYDQIEDALPLVSSPYRRKDRGGGSQDSESCP